MKFYNYIFIVLIAVGLASCEDYFGETANVNPDNPTTATVNVLLPQVQTRLAYTYGGDFTRYLGINTQHVDGVGRQFVVIGNYGILPSDVNSAWNNIYSGVLNSNTVMTDLATDNGSNHYLAAGKILEAYSMMIATDAWGDIPYSDAIKFSENGGVYAPQIDSQQDIYNAIFTLLGEARTLLAGDDGGNAMGGDDLIYGGDPAKWSTFASVLEARGKLHLSKVNGTAAYSDVLAALANGFGSSADEASFAFGDGATENSPWYQYIEQRDDCETGAFYVDLLTSLNDPRLATYGFEHALPHPVFTASQAVGLLTYTEQEFMKAEANLALGNNADAFAALMNAINSSFAEAGVEGDAATYLADNSITEGGLSQDNVMTQKYIALYTSPEVFNDWRRTGIPSLSPNVGSDIPRRLPYSEAEQFANENIPTPAQITIFDSVWWDQ